MEEYNDINDIKVNGPEVAARILNRLPSSQKKRLLKAIATTDITLFQAVSKNIIDFEDIASISDIGIQRIIREVDYHDLLLSLSSADEEIQKSLFRNMSSSKRAVVLEDIEDLPKNISDEELENARRNIAIVMDNLRTSGAISSRVEADEEYV